MRPIVFFIVLASMLLSQLAMAQSAGTSATTIINSVNLVPNGNVNLGTVFVDDRGLTVLGMTPQVLYFTQQGQTQQLTVQAILTDSSAFPLNAANSSVYNVAYAVSTPSVAGVSSTGLVTAISGGTTLVTATALGQTVQSIVAINLNTVLTGLSIVPGSIQLSEVGAQQQLQILTSLSNGFTADVTSQSSTTYVSQNPSVASVSAAGLVTALAAGSATITASYGTVSSTAGVTVTIPAADALSGLTMTSPSSVIRSTSPLQLSVA